MLSPVTVQEWGIASHDTDQQTFNQLKTFLRTDALEASERVTRSQKDKRDLEKIPEHANTTQPRPKFIQQAKKLFVKVVVKSTTFSLLQVLKVQNRIFTW